MPCRRRTLFFRLICFTKKLLRCQWGYSIDLIHRSYTFHFVVALHMADKLVIISVVDLDPNKREQNSLPHTWVVLLYPLGWLKYTTSSFSFSILRTLQNFLTTGPSLHKTRFCGSRFLLWQTPQNWPNQKKIFEIGISCVT